jgi:hypothetical protein
MADITINVPYNGVPVTFTVPKDKLKFEGDKVIGGDENFINSAAEQAYNIKQQSKHGSTLSGKESWTAHPQALPSAVAPFQYPDPNDTTPTWRRVLGYGEDVANVAMGVAAPEALATKAAIKKLIAPTVVGGITDYIANKLGIPPEVAYALSLGTAGATLSPKARGAIAGGVKAPFNNPPEFRRFGPAGMIGAGIGFAQNPSYAGMLGGSLVGGGAEAALEGAITAGKGAAAGARGKPWIPLEITDNFQAKTPNKPSPAVTPPKQLPPAPISTEPKLLGPASSTQMPPVAPVASTPVASASEPQVSIPTIPQRPSVQSPQTWQEAQAARRATPNNMPNTTPPVPIADIVSATEAPSPVAPKFPVKAPQPATAAPVQAPIAPPVIAPKPAEPAVPAAPVAPAQDQSAAMKVLGVKVKPEEVPTPSAIPDKMADPGARNLPLEARPLKPPVHLPEAPAPKTKANNPYNELYPTPDSLRTMLIKGKLIDAPWVAKDTGIDLDLAKKYIVALESQGDLERQGNKFLVTKKGYESKLPTPAETPKVEPPKKVKPPKENLKEPTDAELKEIEDEEVAKVKARKVNPSSKKEQAGADILTRTVNPPGEKANAPTEETKEVKGVNAEQQSENAQRGDQTTEKPKDATTLVAEEERARKAFGIPKPDKTGRPVLTDQKADNLTSMARSWIRMVAETTPRENLFKLFHSTMDAGGVDKSMEHAYVADRFPGKKSSKELDPEELTAAILEIGGFDQLEAGRKGTPPTRKPEGQRFVDLNIIDPKTGKVIPKPRQGYGLK